MDIAIYPAADGDYASPDATSIDDINQIRMNRVEIVTSNNKVVVELHLVGWLLAYTEFLRPYMKGECINISKTITFSGDSFIATCLNGKLISLRMWDIRERVFIDQVLDEKDAVHIHDYMLEYVRDIINRCGGDWNNIRDADDIAID